jgi:hypothetical protein
VVFSRWKLPGREIHQVLFEQMVIVADILLMNLKEWSMVNNRVL